MQGHNVDDGRHARAHEGWQNKKLGRAGLPLTPHDARQRAVAQVDRDRCVREPTRPHRSRRVRRRRTARRPERLGKLREPGLRHAALDPLRARDVAVLQVVEPAVAEEDPLGGHDQERGQRLHQPIRRRLPTGFRALWHVLRPSPGGNVERVAGGRVPARRKHALAAGLRAGGAREGVNHDGLAGGGGVRDAVKAESHLSAATVLRQTTAWRQTVAASPC